MWRKHSLLLRLEIKYFFKNHTKTLSFHCMLNAIKWKCIAFQIKELHLHEKLPTGNENVSILWLKCYTWKYNSYYLYANYIYYQYWITASKDLLKYLETLQSKYIFFFLVVIEQLLIISIIFCGNKIHIMSQV